MDILKIHALKITKHGEIGINQNTILLFKTSNSSAIVFRKFRYLLKVTADSSSCIGSIFAVF